MEYGGAEELSTGWGGTRRVCCVGGDTQGNPMATIF